MEIWKAIKGFEGKYEISNFGKVRSLDRKVRHSTGVIHSIKGKVLRPISVGEYHGVQLCGSNESKKYYIHRLVALHFIDGRSETRNVVNHIDGNKFNNHVENLEWVSQTENHLHALINGLREGYGEKNPMCKFSEETVKQLRDLYDNQIFLQSELSQLYGVSPMQVHRIVKRKLRIGKEGSYEKIRKHS